MKNLQNLFLVFIMISLGFSAAAQTLGVRAGLNLSNLVVKDNADTYSDDYMYMPGFSCRSSCRVPRGRDYFCRRWSVFINQRI